VDVSLVANGVDRAAFQPASIPDSGLLRLICVARLIERKGQQHLIEAVRRLIAEGIAISLDLVGTGDAQSALQAQAIAAGIAGHVHFSGYVSREEIAARYSGAHAFVLPSYNEGMSVATLEALAAGLPVVVTRTGGTAELVAEGVNGLTFDWADVGTLVAHLRRLAADRGLARRMGAASRARAELFSWEAAAARYLKMFDQIAAGAFSSLPNSEVVL
jgi:glycosyltransferase involved in cell wall biosynthesis